MYFSINPSILVVILVFPILPNYLSTSVHQRVTYVSDYYKNNCWRSTNILQVCIMRIMFAWVIQRVRDVWSIDCMVSLQSDRDYVPFSFGRNSNTVPRDLTFKTPKQTNFSLPDCLHHGMNNVLCKSRKTNTSIGQSLVLDPPSWALSLQGHLL